MHTQREFLQFLIRNLATLSVDSLVQVCFHLESGGCRCTPNESKHHIEIKERLACPIHTYVAKEPVFDRVPFGARRRIMSKGDCQPEGVTQLLLKVVFPSPKIISVATTTVGKDQHSVCAGIAWGAERKRVLIDREAMPA
jgi:hypothetical protein